MKKKFIFSFFNKIPKKFLTLFLVPSLVLSVALIFSYSINLISNKETIKQNCTTSLKLYSQICETEITGTIRSCSYFYHSDSLMAFLNGETSINDSSTHYSVISTLENFKSSNNIVDSIFILDKASEQVVSSNGIYSYKDFFTEIYSYKNFSIDYWEKFAFFDHSPHRILSPSAVTVPENNSSVIPIIFRSFSGKRFSKFLVINISLNKLFRETSGYRMTDNANIFMLNRYTGDVFGIDASSDMENIMDNKLYDNLLNTKSSFDFTLNNKKVFIVSYSTSDNLLGYTYFATIPYTDLYRLPGRMVLYSIVIYLISLILSIYISIKSASRVIVPIQHIAALLDSHDNEYSNIFENIHTAIADLQEKNIVAAKTLTFAQEKYLIDCLNSSDLYIDGSTCEVLKHSLPFTGDMFATVIFQIFPKQDFFNHFTYSEYDNIFLGLHNIIKPMFTERFNAVFLSSTRETFYIIINSEDDSAYSQVDGLLNEIYMFLQPDNNFLNIYTGISKVYKGFENLKKAHEEAISGIKPVVFDSPKIILPESRNSTVFISDKDESRLYDALISNDTELARRLLSDFTQKVSDTQLQRHLYVQILNVIFRVMQKKNLTTHEMFENYIEVINGSSDDLYRYIITLLEHINSYKTQYDSNQSGEKIIEYMQNNFTDSNLSLNNLAIMFDVNPNYLSQIIKKNLGIGFHEYLSNLRVSFACSLLTNTEKSIQEIYEACGYYSKQTFFRIFKSATGMTPNEYRKNNSI